MGNHEGIHWIDAGSVGVAIATFFGWLPNIAALLSVIWLLLRLWEMDTIKGLTGRKEKPIPMDLQWLRDAVNKEQVRKNEEDDDD